jgi:hypothetical protein
VVGNKSELVARLNSFHLNNNSDVSDNSSHISNESNNNNVPSPSTSPNVGTAISGHIVLVLHGSVPASKHDQKDSSTTGLATDSENTTKKDSRHVVPDFKLILTIYCTLKSNLRLLDSYNRNCDCDSAETSGCGSNKDMIIHTNDMTVVNDDSESSCK